MIRHWRHKRAGWLSVNGLDLHSESAWCESRLEHLNPITVFVVFVRPLGKCRDRISTRPQPCPSKPFPHYHPYRVRTPSIPTEKNFSWFSSDHQVNSVMAPALRHDHFLPNPFQFVVQKSYCSTHYSPQNKALCTVKILIN
jgi:hypothetical protein